jgi:hypothetical protein
MESNIVHHYDTDRAEQVHRDFHVPNEMAQVQMLLAAQLVILQDIRFHLQNLEELIRYRSQS